MFRWGRWFLLLSFCFSLLVTGVYGEGDSAERGKGENSLASLTIVNKSRLPVIGVYLQPASEASRLATKGAPNVGKEVYSSDINPGGTATIKNIDPDDYVITIVKSNGRGDIIRQTLSAGKSFAYTIE